MTGPALAAATGSALAASPTAALSVTDLSVSFGGRQALDRVSLVAAAGEVTGLIGPNGAGKTTLFDVISGLRAPDEGSVHLGAVDVTRRSPARRARLGLARTFQVLEIWGSLTVAQHVSVPSARGRDVAPLLELVGVAGLAGRYADELTTGQARLLEVARALATEPAVLLLDEPASGLTEPETDRLAALLRQVAADGVAVVLVEHDIRLVLGVSDLVVVLDQGRVLASGSPEQVRRDPRVQAAYLGQPRGDDRPPDDDPPPRSDAR